MKYTHWLKIEDDMIEQVWIRLKEYKDKYECNMEVFYKDTNLINKFIKLECNQSYQDLDLDVNSLSDNGLKHLAAKPKMIHPYNCPIEEFFKRNIKSADNKYQDSLMTQGSIEIQKLLKLFFKQFENIKKYSIDRIDYKKSIYDNKEWLDKKIDKFDYSDLLGCMLDLEDECNELKNFSTDMLNQINQFRLIYMDKELTKQKEIEETEEDEEDFEY